jgi:uncharacterized protein (DUF1330 family)
VPAYLIVDVADIRDAPLYASYRSPVPASSSPDGGRYLARGGHIDILEGDWAPTRLVLARFPSLAAGRRWWASAEYAELKAMRRRATTCHMILVDGLPEKEA